MPQNFRLFRIAWAVLGPVAALVAPAAAEDDLSREIAKCAEIAGNLDRLACFDEMAAAAGLSGPQPEPVETTDTGDWLVKRDRNPIDDSVRVILALEAESGKSRWGSKPILIARCQSNKTELYIKWHDYLGDDDGSVYRERKRVTTRIGKSDAQTRMWSISTDKEATFAPDWAGDLLKEMLSSDRLLAQVTPYGESPVTAVFDTTGLRNALKPLADACNWSFE